VNLRRKIHGLFLRYFPGEGLVYQAILSFGASSQVKSYTATNLGFSSKVARILKKKTPRVDKFLLQREPKLEWENRGELKLVKIDNTYTPEGEIRIDNRPYEALFRSLLPLVRKIQPTTILEVGCTSGNLLTQFADENPKTEISGIEIFEFLRDAAPANIRDQIHIMDLRFPLGTKLQSELVICLEVAEHIDPGRLDVFLDSLYAVTSKYLVMSWSDSYPGPDAPPQHLAPIRRNQYRKVMSKWGFKERSDLTKLCLEIASEEEYFHKW
jgi:SAM-dependent methyltransferase